MAMYEQPKTTYSDQTAQGPRVLSEVIRILDPMDTPLLAKIGGLDAARKKFNLKQNGTKIELLEDTMAAMESDIATTFEIAHTTLIVDDTAPFQDGMVVDIEGELLVIASITNTTDMVVFARASYGQTAAEHAVDVPVYIVGMARLEGDDATFVGITDITDQYNYTSIYERALNVTGTEEAIDYYGMSSPFAYQAKKALPEMFRWINRSLYHGERYVGTAILPRMAGGVNYFVTSNEVDAGGQITKSDIDEVSQLCFRAGGKPDILVMNDEPAKDLHELYDNSSFLRVDMSNDRVGMDPITYVVTQFGTMQLLVDRHCPLSTAYAIKSSDIGLYTLRPFAWEPLARVGDSKKGELVGEFSLLVANSTGMGFISGIT